MRDRTVMVGALTVAGISVASGFLFGGAAGAFGGGPIVTPPALVSTVTVDSLADIEPASFYTSIVVPTVVIPPTPTWQVAPELTAPRNVPLTSVVASTTTSTTAVSSTSSTTAVSSTPASSTPASATPSSARPSGTVTSTTVPTSTGIPVVTIDSERPSSGD
ncbi:hypothetical protein EEB13_27535 [Rhodococcus sp. WS3]|uniref:hypothetical protein n=1 Tax=Rhodococcus sp. WS3 TaxID=2486271 RepID=UPI001142CB4D|nr:hypothetical protein [Rhodococcus sp. WS3]ROZ44719.1 hypothetical protein EEB13_27535 [Rhodococcus sp. WS3]